MQAAYLRVSSTAQDLASQRDAIERYCDARRIVPQWFEEKLSAASERPQLRRLRDLARRGELRRLIVFRLDRLSRGTIREVLNLVNELEAAGCSVESVADGLPLDGPFREVALAMLALCANMEREALRARQGAARARLEASGRAWGRPSRVSVRARTRIAELAGKGWSIRRIACSVKLPRSTVAYWCPKNPGASVQPRQPKKST